MSNKVVSTSKCHLKHLNRNEYREMRKAFHEGKHLKTLAKQLFESYLETHKNHKLRKYDFVKYVLEYAKYDQWKDQYRTLQRRPIEDIIKQVFDDWMNYFKALKSYRKDSSAFTGKPKPPAKYKSLYPRIQFTKHSITINRDNHTIDVKITRNLALTIHVPHDVDIDDIKSVFIGYNGVNFTAYFTKQQEAIDIQCDKNRWIAVDPGVKNLFACVTYDNQAFLFKGSKLIQLVEERNSRVSKLLSRNGGVESRRVKDLRFKYSNKINNELHLLVNSFIELLKQKRIGLVILGKNKYIKRGVNLGKNNNRKFSQLPIFKIYELIELKCKLLGIKVEYQEEAYTSKADALSDEPIESAETRSGKRLFRGLFQSARGVLINADINGALNIARKYLGKRAPMFISESLKYLKNLFNPITILWHAYEPGCLKVSRPTYQHARNINLNWSVLS